MTFHDIRFPLEISLNSEGGPVRRTQIVVLASGHEERNTPWAGARRQFNAGYGIKSLEDIEQIISFFEAREGRLHSFRWRDPFDFKSCSLGAAPQASDQLLGIGDGVQTVFSLAKVYKSGEQAVRRMITKPVVGSVVLALDGVVQQEGQDFSSGHASGDIAFFTPPINGVHVSAGFLFDVPVRFDTDQLSINIVALKAGDIPAIPVIEVFG